MATGSSTSDRTSRNGGVWIAAATTVSSRSTTARYGSPYRSGVSRRLEQIPKIRLCSASRATRKAPAASR